MVAPADRGYWRFVSDLRSDPVARRLRARLVRRRLFRLKTAERVACAIADRIRFHGGPRVMTTELRDDLARFRSVLDRLRRVMNAPSIDLYGRCGATPLNREEWYRFTAQAEALRAWADNLHGQAAVRAKKRNKRAPKDPHRDKLVVDVLLILHETEVSITEASPRARGGSGVTRRAVDVVELALLEAKKAIGDDRTRRALRALVARLWRGPARAILDRRRRVEAALLR